MLPKALLPEPADVVVEDDDEAELPLPTPPQAENANTPNANAAHANNFFIFSLFFVCYVLMFFVLNLTICICDSHRT